MAEYQEKTDEQLIEELRGGDQRIMEFVLEKYKPLVRKKANAMYLIGGDTDDLIQEGMIGLFKAIRDYDGTKEASFFRFAELCINRQIYKVIEASNRKKNAPLNFAMSLFTEMGGEEGALVDVSYAGQEKNPEQMMIDRENFLSLRREIDEALSGMERQVLAEYLSGMNYQQIAEKMNRTPKSIDNALQRIKTKIREKCTKKD